MKKTVVLGFSGGLDTSFCVTYFQDNGYDIHTVLVNTGGFTTAELEEIEAHAYRLGSAKHISIDALHVYYDRIVKFLVFGNVLKYGTYPLSVSAERLVQALHIADYAKSSNADAVAHGSTGAGNDQVRFDMIFQTMIPEMEILTPIRDLRMSRDAEITYLKERGVKMNFEKAVYSVNKGLWGTSIGGRETLKSNGFLPEEAWPTQVTKSEAENVKLSFNAGELFAINDKEFDHPVEAIQCLQAIAGPFGIGRDIHIGDTVIGIKGRVGFEAAAALLIIKAHHTLEKHVLTKWQLYWKDTISSFYGNWLHEGQILDPVMRDMEAFMVNSQQHVCGDVFVQLFPYRFQIQGIDSRFDLMNSRFGEYGEMNNQWTGADVRGFSKIFGNQGVIYERIKQAKA